MRRRMGVTAVAGMMAACAPAATTAAPVNGGVEIAPMVFRCEGWRHTISLAEDGSILADGRKVARIEDGKMKLMRGSHCELDAAGRLVDHKGDSCTGRLVQVLPDHTLRTHSGIVRFEGTRMVFETDGGPGERVCSVEGYREGREGAVAMLLATAGVVVMVDAIGEFVRSGEDGKDAGEGGRE